MCVERVLVGLFFRFQELFLLELAVGVNLPKVERMYFTFQWKFANYQNIDKNMEIWCIIVWDN